MIQNIFLVENNALNATNEKQRQDAKWSLPYLEGEKKTQTENLVSDLDAKDKAFDAAIDATCQNLSSAQCSGMRQELAAMGKSYDCSGIVSLCFRMINTPCLLIPRSPVFIIKL